MKIEKGNEELEDLNDEVRGGRKRSRRIVKTNTKRKLRFMASEEEDIDSEEMTHPKQRIKHKTLNYGLGNEEET